MEQIDFQTFFDVELWDAARWTATAYMHDLDGVEPPCLGIVFGDMEAGKQIFARWRERLGDVDLYDELRISIVEGEILGLDSGYTVHISSDPLHTLQRAHTEGLHLDFRKAIIMSQCHRMTPAPGYSHLARFRKELQKHRRYLLLPVSLEGAPDFENSIWKTEIYLRQASDVRADDVDSVVFPAHHFGGNGTIH